MSVRAKFRVREIKRTCHWDRSKGEIQTIVLEPVGRHNGPDESEENKAFFAATPSGQIELGVVNAAAAQEFDLGAEFYVDFTLAVPNG